MTCPYLIYQARVFVVRSIPSAMPSHAKKEGFVAQRHNDVRNLVTSFLGKVCTNVEVEPQLQPLDYEQFNLRRNVDKSGGKAGHAGRGLLVSRNDRIF